MAVPISLHSKGRGDRDPSTVRDARRPAAAQGKLRTARTVNPRAEIDEELFAGMYRAGTYSNRAIAAKFLISEAFVRKLAKRLELTKDLSGQVRAKVQDNILRAAVRSEKTMRTDAEIIADAAEQGTAVVLGHCRSLSKLRKTADMLSDQLDFAATNREALEAILKEATEPAQRAASLRKLLNLSTHAGVAKDLAAVYQTVIRVERQALGLDEEGTETSWEETLRKLSDNA